MTLSTNVSDLSGVEAYDLVGHLRRQRAFSERAFGPGRCGAPDHRELGVIDHIRKELDEIAREPLSVEEWIDVAILAFDGAWRTGASPEQIAETLAAKQRRNEARRWPDWRAAAIGKAIEHVRETLFVCRYCGECSVKGWSDGAVSESGWSQLDNIDGPSYVCPGCGAAPETVLQAFRDEYPNVQIRPVSLIVHPPSPEGGGRAARERTEDPAAELRGKRLSLGPGPDGEPIVVSGDLVAELAASLNRASRESREPLRVVASDPGGSRADVSAIAEALAREPDGGDAVLRELLRTDPNRAVRVVDSACIARPWTEELDRSPLGPGPFVALIEEFPPGSAGSREWEVRSGTGDTFADGCCATTRDAKDAADASLAELGWVCATEIRA